MSRSSIKSDFAALEEDRSTADAALLGAVTAALGIAPTKPKRGPGSSSPEPFWKKRGGLLLRDVWYDPKEDVFVVTFEAGATYRVPLAKVPHRGIVFAVALDEFRHGVNIACADGTSTNFASDWVLYECEDEYRKLHASHARAPDFGRRTREIRISKGLKAVEVAKACSMAPSNYARLEASKHRPSVETLGRVADALGVPLARLVAKVE